MKEEKQDDLGRETPEGTEQTPKPDITVGNTILSMLDELGELAKAGKITPGYQYQPKSNNE